MQYTRVNSCTICRYGMRAASRCSRARPPVSAMKPASRAGVRDRVRRESCAPARRRQVVTRAFSSAMACAQGMRRMSCAGMVVHKG